MYWWVAVINCSMCRCVSCSSVPPLPDRQVEVDDVLSQIDQMVGSAGHTRPRAQMQMQMHARGGSGRGTQQGSPPSRAYRRVHAHAQQRAATADGSLALPCSPIAFRSSPRVSPSSRSHAWAASPIYSRQSLSPPPFLPPSFPANTHTPTQTQTHTQQQKRRGQEDDLRHAIQLMSQSSHYYSEAVGVDASYATLSEAERVPLGVQQSQSQAISVEIESAGSVFAHTPAIQTPSAPTTDRDPVCRLMSQIAERASVTVPVDVDSDSRPQAQAEAQVGTALLEHHIGVVDGVQAERDDDVEAHARELAKDEDLPAEPTAAVAVRASEIKWDSIDLVPETTMPSEKAPTPVSVVQGEKAVESGSVVDVELAVARHVVPTPEELEVLLMLCDQDQL
jgi:hypothetical protein